MIRRMTALVVLVCALPAGAVAQQSKRNALGVSTTPALLLAGVVGLMPLDAHISEQFAAPWPQQNRILHGSASLFNKVGDPGAAVISVTMWGAGLISGSPQLKELGFHATEAVAISSAATGIVKGFAGRMRPNASPGDADNFMWGGGFTGEGGASFPSGHTTAAFALAATLSSETRLHNPEAARYVTPIAYGAASLVGLSRIYSQKHWTSDVLLGAVVGTYSARWLFDQHHRKKR